jgi:hypothetical protein
MAHPNDIVQVVNIIEQSDGNTRVIFDVSPNFANWFKGQGLGFQKVLTEALQGYIYHNPIIPILDPELEEPASSSDDEALYKIFGGD